MNQDATILATLALSFQTLGVVYGDLGTSPLYVFADVFTKVPIESDVDVLGALSLVMYTIALLPLIKYVFIVLKANDNGEGGTFALYSLICRYANVSMLPNHQQADEHISSYRLKLPSPELKRALDIKETLERNSALKTLLLLLVLLGTSLIIGDGILTPAMSVMSAISGLQGEVNCIDQDKVVTISIIVLVALFSIQKFGTIMHDISVLRAINPAYIYYFFKKNGKKAWSALGGCVLSVTGSLFWPVFVIATLAAMIASQAMISATFSCIKQSMALGCFPRLKIIHTSTKFIGQIYIPVINWFLMLMCIIIVSAFRSTTDIANAYGIAEVGVMMVSTTLVTLVMLLIWQNNLFMVISFLLIFGSVEFIYMSSVLSKIFQGGWIPLAFATIFLSIMYTWNYGSVLKYKSEVKDKISLGLLHDLGPNLGTVRVQGIGLLYTELVQGIPSIFVQFLLSLPAIHSTIIFVCIKYVPIPMVPQEERFIFRRVCSKEYRMFRCVARYGYKEGRKEDHHEFEQLLIQSLEDFLIMEAQESNELMILPLIRGENCEETNGDSAYEEHSLEHEISALREAKAFGCTYLLGHGDVRAKKNSLFLKKLVINYFYAFLRRNCRAGTASMRVPQTKIIQLRRTYMV
ncbi:hypothetical protein TSUD_238980 [Trifolium subterraneum]|uniref:Potassium transporter n=1 Tax=Trifolium subterraneum TaxID=3900 RepID=A0A2Z6NBP1_TRISU|nr:hypothetical protein TSUD_238980 [Trifolium subterraneum]